VGAILLSLLDSYWIAKKSMMADKTEYAQATNNILQTEQISQRILRALQGIRYGSIEIIVHDGRVVQIERTEKLRFEQGDSGTRR
jgi:hypothetical protein